MLEHTRKRNMRISTSTAMLIVMLQATFLGAIGLQQIDSRNLPNIDSYSTQLDFVFQNESSLGGFIPDEYWKGPLTKAQMAEKLISIYSILAAQKNDPVNQDLCLLKGLICSYLYNLNYVEYLQKAVENFNLVESVPNHDYRFKWMLGMLDAKAAKPFQAIPQFSYVAKAIPQDKLHPLFWMDYAYAAGLAFMPVSAIHYFDIGSQYGGYNLEKNSLYQDFKKNLIMSSKDGTIPKDELYGVFQRDSGLGIFSRPLGIWLPIKEDWSLRMADYVKDQSFVMMTPAAIKAKNGQDITYTIAAFFKVADTDIQAKWMESYEHHKQVSGLVSKPRLHRI